MDGRTFPPLETRGSIISKDSAELARRIVDSPFYRYGGTYVRPTDRPLDGWMVWGDRRGTETDGNRWMDGYTLFPRDILSRRPLLSLSGPLSKNGCNSR